MCTALMALMSKSKVCGMHKKSRMELRQELMTLNSKSKVCQTRKKEQNGARMRNNDPKE